MKGLFNDFREGMKVLILGFGKEGQSTYRYLKTHYPGISVDIADRDAGLAERCAGLLSGFKGTLHLGENYLDVLEVYPLIIKSPGVALPENIPAAIRHHVTSQTDLVLKTFHRQIIGITGTKGKSTTSSLVHHILLAAGKNSILVGNIGAPPFDQLLKINPGTLIVFEMSSHQLEDSVYAPYIAVLLNLFPEHLDRYPSLKAYYDAKMKIVTGQQENDIFIYNEDIPEIGHRISGLGLERKYLTFSSGIKVKNGSFLEGDTIFLAGEGKHTPFITVTDEFALKGRHNRLNMMAAILATSCAGIDDEDIRRGLATFKGLEHRLEYAGEFRGIHFYNDSIATIPEATLAAVNALPGTDTLILGGYDRMLDYTELVASLSRSRIRNFIFLGKAGQRMYELFRFNGAKSQNLFLVNNLEEAFRIIPAVTEPGKICLLSPAAASYDIFRNFEERGSIFKKLAGNI